jgi:hypothetical protein
MGILRITKKDAEGNIISEEVIDTLAKPSKETKKEEKKDEPVKRRKKRKQAGSDSE